MLKTYDTVILGCGEAGVFAGYELIHRNPGMKVLIVDQGQDIYHRSCPIVAGKVKSCIDCKVCHTMCGFGGAGAFSDGKYQLHHGLRRLADRLHPGKRGHGPDRLCG